MNRPAPRRAGALLDVAVVAVAGAAFLLLTLYQLHLPGLYYDEAWDAVTTMGIVQGTPLELERGAHLTLFGRAWPLMLDDYQGIVSTYLLVPFFLIGGVNVFALRAFPIASGLLAVGLCYALARAWFGRPAARIAVLLFAVAPSWIFWSRLGVYVVAEVVPLTLGALLAFTAWWRAPRGHTGLLALGSFLLGLGLATKLLYVWPILAIAICYILLHGRTVWEARGRGLAALRPAWLGAGVPGPAAAGAPAPPSSPARRPPIVLPLLLAVACFVAGAFPFLAYNWQTRGTWLKIRGSAVQTEYGANNTTVLPNLWEEADRFRQLLDGGYFWFQVDRHAEYDATGQAHDSAAVYKDPGIGLAFVAAALGLLAAAIRRLPAPAPAGRPGGQVLLRIGLALLPALGLAAAAGLRPNSRNPLLVVPAVLAVALAVGAAVSLLRVTARGPAAGPRRAGAVLLGLVVLGGLTWFLMGAPDGAARGPFDLRVADVAGLLFWVSLFTLLALLGWNRPAAPGQRPLVAALGYLAAVLAQSFPTLSGLWATHLLVMLPLPQIVIGAALASGGWARAAHPEAPPAPSENRARRAARRANPARLRAVGALGLVAALLAGALWTDYRYHRDLTRTGGLFAFSDGIYNLAAYLGKAADRPVVAAEWGIRRPVQILSAGQIAPAEIFQYGANTDPATLAAFDAALAQTLPDPTTRYVFTAGTIGPYNRFPEFQRVLAARGLQPFLEHRSYMRDGRPIYEVYTAQPAPP